MEPTDTNPDIASQYMLISTTIHHPILIGHRPSKKLAPTVESQDNVEKVIDSNAQRRGVGTELVENYLDADSSEGLLSAMAQWASASVFLAISILLFGAIALRKKRRENMHRNIRRLVKCNLVLL